MVIIGGSPIDVQNNDEYRWMHQATAVPTIGLHEVRRRLTPAAPALLATSRAQDGGGTEAALIITPTSP